MRVLFGLLLFIPALLGAQTEYLVKVNPADGSFIKIDSIPGVKWILSNPEYAALDYNAQRYTFCGRYATPGNHLFTLDAITAQVLHAPPFPVLSDAQDNVMNLHYDQLSGLLYGLHWDHSEDREYLVQVHPVNGNFTLIDSIPGVKMIISTAFNSAQHRYIVHGLDASGQGKLYSVDVNTGTVVSSPAFPQLTPPDKITHLIYNNTLTTLYGLLWNHTEQREYLVRVDVQTGAHTLIDSISGLAGIPMGVDNLTLDEIQGRCIVGGLSHQGQNRLYTVDLATGAVLHAPLFPGLTPPDNVIKMRAGLSNGDIVALHWESKTASGVSLEESAAQNTPLRVFPNPYNGQAIVQLDKEHAEIYFSIYNAAGEEVHSGKRQHVAQIVLDRRLSAGVYFIRVWAAGRELGAQKLIAE